MAATFPSRPIQTSASAFVTPWKTMLPIGVTRVRSKVRIMSKNESVCTQFVRLPTGINMEVIEVRSKRPSLGASAERPPLIFIHGSFHAAWCFRFFQPFFASHGFSSYAVSLRGAGNTDDLQSSNPTVEEHVSDLSALLRVLDLPTAPVIIGHSIGGFIVQKLVERENSQPLSALVLMSSTPPSGNSKLVRRIMSQVGFWKTFRITMGFIRRTAAKNVSLCREMFFSPKSSEWFSEDIEGDQKLREYMELFKKTSKTLDVRSLKNVVQGTGVLKGRVFVIGGTADSLVDVAALEESASFWEGDICVLKDAPHDIMLYSKWEEAASLILEWITNRCILT